MEPDEHLRRKSASCSIRSDTALRAQSGAHHNWPTRGCSAGQRRASRRTSRRCVGRIPRCRARVPRRQLGCSRAATSRKRDSDGGRTRGRARNRPRNPIDARLRGAERLDPRRAARRHRRATATAETVHQNRTTYGAHDLDRASAHANLRRASKAPRTWCFGGPKRGRRPCLLLLSPIRTPS